MCGSTKAAAPTAAPVKQLKFQKGDRVEIVSSSYGGVTRLPGNIGTVKEAGQDNPNYYMVTTDGDLVSDPSPYYYSEHELKAYETPIVPLQAPIEVGSKVRVLASCGAFDAQKPVEGVVVEKRFMEDGGPMFLVEHTVKVWVTAGGLEAIKQDDPQDHDAWAPKVDLSLRVGARVEIVDDRGGSRSKIGMKGIIIELEEGGAGDHYGHFARLSMDDGQVFHLYELRFKVIG